MFDRYFRALKDRLLMPVARALGPRLPPNAITWTAFAVGMASAVAILADRRSLAVGLWLLNRALDGLDGTQARAHERESDFGAYLDIVLDFVVYAAIPAALVAATPADELTLAGLLLLASFYVNAASWMYLAAILEKRNAGAAARGELTSVTMPPGVIGGTETLLFYLAFLLLPSYTAELFYVMAALVLTNVGMRLWWARRTLPM
jgi:phosphatidylglycerophosphate synthase